MTDTPITSARVRELSSKATPGKWDWWAGESAVHQTYFDVPRGSPGSDKDDAELVNALCSEPARAHIAKALDLLERVEAVDAGLVAKVAMLLDHPSVYMGGPSAQSKRKAGYLLHELAALVGEG